MRYETRVDRQRRHKRAYERVKAGAIIAGALIGVAYIVMAFYVHY